MTTELGMASSIKSYLLAQTWTGSSNVVFPSNAVAIVASIAESVPRALETKRVPCALIAVAEDASDPEHDEEPDLLRALFDVAIIAMVGGDAIGEFVMIGGALSGGATKSEGQGILKVQQEVYNAIGKRNAQESVTLQYRQKAGQGAVYDKDRATWIAWRILRFEAWCTAV